MISKTYLVYIVTNQGKTVLYIGFTNNLAERLIEHYLNKGSQKTFTGRYNCYNLLYYETFFHPSDGIYREKELKGWTRKKKINLIKSVNPELNFINSEFLDWPPASDVVRRNEW